MSSVTVVTSFSPEGYELYGRRFIRTFFEHWPREVRLIVYYEAPDPEFMGRDDLDTVDLLSLPDACSFIERHSSNSVARGRQQAPGREWPPKDIAAGYNLRFDAVKFCRKVFAVAHAATEIVHSGRMFWCDADIVTFEDVPAWLFEHVLPDGIYTCYLGREGTPSETGFVGYRADHPDNAPFMETFAGLYASDAVFDLHEWDDRWAYDHVREKLRVPSHAIPHGDKGHPFINSVLGRYMDHLKGARKEDGRSKPEAMVVGHDHSYWRQTRGSFLRKVDARVRHRKILKSLVKKTYYAIAPVCPPLRALKKRYDDSHRR